LREHPLDVDYPPRLPPPLQAVEKRPVMNSRRLRLHAGVGERGSEKRRVARQAVVVALDDDQRVYHRPDQSLS
jgi:hypothetical protein